MKRSTAPPDSTALLAFIADALQRHLEQEPSLLAACAGLQRTGSALVVRVESSPGGGPAKIILQSPGAAVPEWSPEDREILRSVGIACEDNNRTTALPTESGRCDQS
ncbi:MAG: hypothetical protein HY825_08985 [Acidobacteria bacterium]|nr:hypothetical protein [Acidobacteriota bacterium]